MTGPETVDICICTYRRDHLAETLQTVLAQDLPEGLTARIIVADNDIEPSAQMVVEAATEGAPIPVTYVHAPARNISIARNACLDAATGDWVAFIDDDEIAPPDWIATLWQAARDTGADVMFGPAIAIYPAGTPDWIVAEDYHTNRVPMHDGQVSTGHTCNVLMRWHGSVIAGERYRLENGRTGGEDVEFFFRLSRLGFVMGNCDAAAVSEHTGAGRLSYRWLRQRKFAAGQFHG
ncbi:MAG: glycosyltransferase family 2 protein, partial [Pseudomonadota bacterium]